MNPMDVSDYDYDQYFDKLYLLEFAEKVNKIIMASGYQAGVWTLQPWSVAFIFQATTVNLTKLMVEIYQLEEVQHVQAGIEQASKMPVISIIMNAKWFVERAQNAEAKRKAHPENRG